jgi:hypothetical protein
MTWAVFALLVLAIPAFAADESKPAKRTDTTAELLKKLNSTPNIAEGDFRFSEFCDYLTKTHGVPVVVNQREFTLNGQEDLDEPVLKFKRSDSLPLTVHIQRVLGSMRATYLVRKGHIEILPLRAAIRETKNERPEGDDEQMRAPLVSMIFKEKPLNEVIAELAEDFELTVVISPKAGDAQTGFVTARLLNVPADKAIELLALQCDLRVVRKGTAYMITNPEHANDLFTEKLDRERAKVELENLRSRPGMTCWGFAFPQGPNPAPAPAPAPKQ